MNIVFNLVMQGEDMELSLDSASRAELEANIDPIRRLAIWELLGELVSDIIKGTDACPENAERRIRERLAEAQAWLDGSHPDKGDWTDEFFEPTSNDKGELT